MATDIDIDRLAHDMRGPLNIALGYVQLIEAGDEGLSDDHRRYVAEIGKACERLSHMIDSLQSRDRD